MLCFQAVIKIFYEVLYFYLLKIQGPLYVCKIMASEIAFFSQLKHKLISFQVLKCVLDSRPTLIYKPRCFTSEDNFNSLCGEMS